ncbi:MAG: DUF6524 family protein [Pseudomonadota bacterium]
MSWFGFLLRIIFTEALVLGTYNPTGWSFYHWVRGGFETDLPLKALAAIVLVIGYVICVRATFRSIGIAGIVLIAALLAALGWVAYDYGYLTLENVGLMHWLILISAGLILGVGLCWSHVRRMISGQLDTDDVDE